MLIRRKSQSATEYAIFIAAVLVALLALQVYYSRAVKGNVKTRADSVGEQLNTDTGVNNVLETRSVSGRLSVAGYNETSDNWSKSTIREEGDPEFSTIIKGAGSSGLLSGCYTGGEASSTDYVKAEEFGNNPALGTSGNATMADFTGTPKSVWNETGIKTE